MASLSWIRGRPPWVWALVAVLAVGVVVTALVLAGRGAGTDTATPGTASTRPTTTSTVSIPATTPTTPTGTISRTTTSRATTTTKVAPVPVPEITVASAGSSGGSGEVQVSWHAVARATGYRVYRTDHAGNGARLMVDVNTTSGVTKAQPGVINLWSDEHTYLPDRGPLATADHSSRFDYVDVGQQSVRCYRVGAYNAAGTGPLSAVSCGTPVVGPAPSLPA